MAAIHPSMFGSDTDLLAVEELIIQLGDASPYTHKLNQLIVTIGRENGNDITLKEGGISRHHARMEWRSGVWYVTDLASTNGSWMDENKLEAHRPYPWSFGAVLTVGDYTLELRQQEPEIPDMTEFLLPDEIDEEVQSLRAFYSQPPERHKVRDPFTFGIWPAKATHNGKVIVAIQNEGNASCRYHVTASGDQAVGFTQDQWTLEIPAGTEKRFAFLVHAKQRPLFGEKQTRPFQVHVVSENEETETAVATVAVDARISTGMLALCFLFLILTVTGFVATFGF